MLMKPVTSSQIEAIGHENGVLAVKYKSGGTYHYADVPPATFDAMIKAPSVGSFLHANIKGKHSFKKVT